VSTRYSPRIQVIVLWALARAVEEGLTHADQRAQANALAARCIKLERAYAATFKRMEEGATDSEGKQLFKVMKEERKTAWGGHRPWTSDNTISTCSQTSRRRWKR